MLTVASAFIRASSRITIVLTAANSTDVNVPDWIP
jgi:hypothetical protein